MHSFNEPQGPAHFSTTHWSLIAAAGAETSPHAHAALEALCRRYWFPLYAYVRREGVDQHDAQDLTQEFFTRFLDKDYLGDVSRERGKFRSFLLASLKHFLANQWDGARAKKRGGGSAILSLDFQDAEERYRREPADMWTAEKLYQRRWAVELLSGVLERLRAEAVARGNERFFDAVKDNIAGFDARGHAEVAGALGMTEGAVKTAVHRLRRRYRALLREEISQTVSDPAQVDGEIQQLFTALQGK
jgi:RNA polymerase sigma-70 factor (ECF subfamily)